MYTIDRSSDVPLYIQIREGITSSIEAGELHPGDRLPSASKMAKEIGVTQATVRRALHDLTESGHTDSHVGRGTFILKKGEGRSTGDDANMRGEERRSVLSGGVDPLKISAIKRMRTGVSKALYDIMPLAHKPGIIQLTQGVPDPALLPEEFVSDVCQDVFKTGSGHLVEATDPMGMYELREEIARRASLTGATVTAENVLITNGVSQGITLVAEEALQKPREVICETPGFLGVANTMTALGHWVETVDRDESGPRMEQLERFSKSSPKLLYLCTCLHNPTGVNVSDQRMEDLSRWARQNNAILLSDEIFKDLQYKPSKTLDLLSKLGCERTMVVSSLSKTVMGGMRLGWIISSPERIKVLAGLKKLMDHATPTLIQAMGLEILTSGRYDSLTADLQQIYHSRMDVMLESLEKQMPSGVKWSKPEGGFSMLVELPPGYSSVALLLFAVEHGVSFLPGPLFDIDHRYVNYMRLSCAWADEYKIKEGIELLANAVTDFISRPPGDSGLSGLGGYQ